MGVDAFAVCNALPKGWLLRMSGPKTLNAIATIARDWATDHDLGPFYDSALQPDGSLAVALMPLADAIQFSVAGGRLTVRFRSSPLGPGYHAAVVDLLDHLAASLRIFWAWTDGTGADLDETTYGHSRDIPALQRAMAGYLRGLGGVVRSMAPDARRALTFCLPIGLGQEEGQIGCPTGFRPAAWADSLNDLDDAALMDQARNFFPWWDRALTAQTWESLLRALLWQCAEWRPPETRHDHQTYRQIAHAKGRVESLGGRLPADLTEALRQFDQHQLSQDPPVPAGIGYRKRLVSEQIFRAWSIRRPAFARPVPNDPGVAWEHPGFSLQASALSVQTAPGQDGKSLWPDRYDGPEQTIRPGITYRLTAREATSGGAWQQAAFVQSPRVDVQEILIVSLISPHDWPFDHFASWLQTITCPDLPPAPLH